MKAVMNRGQVGTISQLQLGGNDEDRAKLASTQACPTRYYLTNRRALVCSYTIYCKLGYSPIAY